jgi:tetratricopeptide (TPR) repeat protein
MDKDELLEKYFSNSLGIDEKQQLGDVLANDAVFAARFEDEKKIQAAIYLHHKQHIKQQLQTFEQKEIPVKKILTTRFLVAAASVLIIGSIVAFYFYTKPNYQQLYAAYYTTMPNTIAPIVRGGDTTAKNDTLYQAFYAYEQGNFASAVTAFNKLQQYPAYKEAAFFYKAICLMELQQYPLAIEVFKQTKPSINYNFTEAAQWYTALCYLQLHEVATTKQLLQNLANGNSVFAKQSRELLNEL